MGDHDLSQSCLPIGKIIQHQHQKTITRTCWLIENIFRTISTLLPAGWLSAVSKHGKFVVGSIVCQLQPTFLENGDAICNYVLRYISGELQLHSRGHCYLDPLTAWLSISITYLSLDVYMCFEAQSGPCLFCTWAVNSCTKYLFR